MAVRVNDKLKNVLRVFSTRTLKLMLRDALSDPFIGKPTASHASRLVAKAVEKELHKRIR
jgi:hypothetical protein